MSQAEFEMLCRSPVLSMMEAAGAADPKIEDADWLPPIIMKSYHHSISLRGERHSESEVMFPQIKVSWVTGDGRRVFGIVEQVFRRRKSSFGGFFWGVENDCPEIDTSATMKGIREMVREGERGQIYDPVTNELVS